MNRIPVMAPWLGEEEAEAAAAAVRSGWIAQGPRVAEFEERFAAAVGAPHAVAVSSGTAALHLALLAAGIGPGDEVVVPSLSFVATASAVRYAGAEPVFADVDAATGNLVPGTVAPLLTRRTRAVLLADQGGVPADLDAMRTLCAPRGVAVLEDAACAAGARLRGVPAGGRAAFATFSFHPRKLLTTGEGGMVTCRDGAAAARLRRLREHGSSRSAAHRHAARSAVPETYDELGFNYRMTDVQAAIGLVQLRRLPRLVAERRRLAGRYRALLAAALPGWRMAADPPYGRSNFQTCWVLAPREAADRAPHAADPPGGAGRRAAASPWRDAVLARLEAAGISARRGIMAAHLEKPYAGTARVPLPVTERLTRDSLTLPLFHGMTAAQQHTVVAALAAAVRAP